MPHGPAGHAARSTAAAATPRKTQAKKLLEADSPVLAKDGRAPPERGPTSKHTAPGPRTRLGAGITTPVGARIDWASLIRRVYLDDVLACPCGGRRRVLAEITEPAAIAAILQHLGHPTEPPPIARARSPGSEAA